MPIVLGNQTWPPSELQLGVPLDSGRPNDSALQRALDAENRSWLKSENYLFSRHTASFFSRQNGGVTATVFSVYAHNPVGLNTLRFQVRGRYNGGTGATVTLKENGAPVALVNLTTTTIIHTVFSSGPTPGDVRYDIEVQTQAGSQAEFPGIWLSWGDFI